MGVELEESIAQTGKDLNSEVLKLLGDVRQKEDGNSGSIHKDLALRWQSILQSGLESENRYSIMAKYPVIGNCPLSAAPKLNLEVKASVSEAVTNRDSRLANLQSQIGAALSALGKALTILLDEEDEKKNNLQVIELMSDAGRLMADLHHEKSKSRRVLISSDLNKTFKETLTDASLDGWLFGDNLGDRMKVAKALEKSSLELRTPGARKQTRGSLPNSLAPAHLNSKGPTRPPVRGLRPVGPRTAQLRGNNRLNSRPTSRQPVQGSNIRKNRQFQFRGRQ